MHHQRFQRHVFRQSSSGSKQCSHQTISLHQLSLTSSNFYPNRSQQPFTASNFLLPTSAWTRNKLGNKLLRRTHLQYAEFFGQFMKFRSGAAYERANFSSYRKIGCVHLRCKAPLLENASHISGSNVFEITAKFKHHTYKSLRSNFIPSCCYCLFTRTGTIAERHGTVLSRNSGTNCHKCLEPSRHYQTNIPKRQKYT